MEKERGKIREKQREGKIKVHEGDLKEVNSLFATHTTHPHYTAISDSPPCIFIYHSSTFPSSTRLPFPFPSPSC